MLSVQHQSPPQDLGNEGARNPRVEVLLLALWKSIILALLSVRSSVFGTVFPSLSPAP